MGFFSFICAASGQSIPASCVEATDVTLFLPDGTRICGEYDGYGRVGCFDIYGGVEDNLHHNMIRFEGEDDEVVSVTDSEWMGMECWEIRTKKGANYMKRKKEFASIEDAIDCVLRDCAASDMHDFVAYHIKLVKTKYVKKGMTYESLPASKPCPYQGYFYTRKGQWNKRLTAKEQG